MTFRRVLPAVAAGLLVPAMLLGSSLSASASEGVPYDDPGATGDITLCDRDLNPLTQGSIDDVPFVWRAVGSQAAPAPYNDDNRRAVLYAFQPRQGVAPGQWSGDLLTAASTYTDASHPIAQSTILDFPLKVFVNSFPPRWQGLLQLRLYYTTDGAAPSTTYAAADLKVTGTQWRVLNPGHASCDSGDAVSPEIFLPQFKKSAKAVEAEIAKKEKHEQQQQSPEPSASPSPTSSSTSSAKKTDRPIAAVDPGSEADDTSSGGPTIALAIAGSLVLVVAAVVLATWRRQRS